MKQEFPIIGKVGTWFFQSLEIAAFVVLLAGRVCAADASDQLETDAELIAGKAALQDGFCEIAQKKFEAYLDAAFFQKSKAKGAVYLAQALLGQGKAAEAAKYLSQHQSWGKGTPSESAFAFWLARAQFDLGQADDALKTLRDFETRFPNDRLAPAVTRLRAHAYLKAARREKAIEAFAEFAKAFPRDEDAPANLLDWAGVLMEDMRYRDAESLLQQLGREYPDSAAAARGSLWLGELLSERGADEQARMILGGLLAQTNLSPAIASRGWLAAAAIYERGSNIEMAVTALQRGEVLTTNADTQVEARLRRAVALTQLGRTADAGKLLDDTLRIFPTQPRSGEALLALGDLRMGAKDYRGALDYYQHYLESAPGTNGLMRAMQGRANALWFLQRFGEAADSYEKAAAGQASAPLRETLRARAANAQFLAGQFKAARESAEKFAREFPESARLPELLLQAAESDARLGDAAAAERDLRDVERRFAGEPFAEAAILRRAKLQEDTAHWQGAEQVYGEFLAQYPRSERRLEALLARANVRYRTGDFPAAVSDCDLILKDAPDSAAAEQAFFLRARCVELQGDAARAAELGQQFLLKFPGSKWAPDVAFWIAEQAFNRRDYLASEKMFADIARDYSSNRIAADSSYWAGRSAAAADDYSRAVSFYSQVAKHCTNSPLLAEARFAQGDALSVLAEYAAAILAFDEVIRIGNGTPLADMARGRKGDCLFTLGADKPDRYRDALVSYRAVMDSATADSDLKLQAEFKLARCLEKMGRRADASEHFLNVVYGWLSQRRLGNYPDAVWFTRAAFAAAAMKEEDKQIADAIKIYERVIESGVPAGDDAQRRIEKLKSAAPPK
jgi:TolA-binding protein